MYFGINEWILHWNIVSYFPFKYSLSKTSRNR